MKTVATKVYKNLSYHRNEIVTLTSCMASPHVSEVSDKADVSESDSDENG